MAFIASNIEDRCNFLLGGITDVKKNKFEFLNDPDLDEQLNKFASEIHDASIPLKNSIFYVASVQILTNTIQWFGK